MSDWQKAVITINSDLKTAIQAAGDSSMRCALIVDADYKLQGMLTDGDIRRYILQGVNLDLPVVDLMNSSPLVAKKTDSTATIKSKMLDEQLLHMPVVDENNKLVNFFLLDQFMTAKHMDNTVVIMAGGIGSRLMPMTESCPKPMLEVGGKPILETIINNLVSYGLHNIVITVNYKSEMIQDYFGDGAKFSANISYIKEPKRMGTAGALSLLSKQPTKPVIVMNADLLTKLNFKSLLEYHKDLNCDATMCVREYNYEVPFGVIDIDGCKVKTLLEKPTQAHLINAGVYVLNPEVLKLIPQAEFFDMPDLFNKITSSGGEASAFPIREYWLDIGQHSQLSLAKEQYAKLF